MDIIPQDDTPRKRCTRCKQLKLLTEFHRNRSNPDKLHFQCKPCRKEMAKQPKRLIPPEGYKQCTKCKEVKLL
ncbi:MAG TPA: hypothetical protein VJ761_04995, partial [Ktedonobacteraceae bacterium]|nr:hypothetical protein [Ktedonobacteraceae bacterium]